MSVQIESLPQLMQLLQKTNVRFSSAGELRDLLARINAGYDPEAARQRTGRLVGIAVPLVSSAAAALVTFVLFVGIFDVRGPHRLTGHDVAALALIWGAWAAVSVVAVSASLLMTRVRRRPVPADRPTAGRPSTAAGRVETAITNGLSL